MSINTSNISINNFNNVCRTCAQTNDLISIQENIYIIEMLSTSVLNLQIQLNDDLPQQICINCIKDLNQSYTFIGKCKAADAAFRQCIAQQKLLNLTQNHEKNKPKDDATVEIYIKTEIHANDEIDHCSDSSQSQIEIKKEQTQHDDNINETNNDIELHLSDYQFKNLDEPMEMEESSDDDDPSYNNIVISGEKSQTKYKRERERNSFLTYCKENNLSNITEDIVYDYFVNKSKTFKSSTLWCSYFMLKSALLHDENIDISKYSKLLAFLKHKSVGPKNNVTFTRDQINRFLREAPDKTYLMMKVAMIMGIAGGCHVDELMRMTLDHIEDKDSVIVVTVPIPKTTKTRSFLLTSNESDWIAIYRKYYKCRVTFMTEQRRLFLNYKNGKFTNQQVGKNTIGKFPKIIAEFLNLANPAKYTGHCFRRASALLFDRRRLCFY